MTACEQGLNVPSNCGREAEFRVVCRDTDGNTGIPLLKCMWCTVAIRDRLPGRIDWTAL